MTDAVTETLYLAFRFTLLRLVATAEHATKLDIRRQTGNRGFTIMQNATTCCFCCRCSAGMLGQHLTVTHGLVGVPFKAGDILHLHVIECPRTVCGLRGSRRGCAVNG